MAGIFHLYGVVKHYDWGGQHFIPGLIKQKNGSGEPFAEYWMGTHPLGEGQVETDKEVLQPLSSFTGTLPYLFKVLDVKDMLSIQVHPTKEAAVKGFALENAAGVPPDAPNRNYRDDNHKPELMVALGDFWLLHGFKPPEELVYTLLNVVELRELLPIFNQSGYSGLYRHIMTMPQTDVNQMLQPLINNLGDIYKEGKADKYDEDYWAAKAAVTFNRNGNMDRGIFSIYLFNLVHLKNGEGIFQAAGVPHAYLEGQNVEIMANSDNVLRGGLTSKHIDVIELLKHVKCEATYPKILFGEETAKHILTYKVPVNDFRLDRISFRNEESIKAVANAAEILIATDGRVRIDETGKVLEPGHPAAIILAGSSYSITGLDPESVIFRASGSFTAVNK